MKKATKQNFQEFAKKIIVQPYGISLELIFTNNLELSQRKRRKVFGDTVEEADKQSQGIFLINGMACAILFDTNTPITHDVIAHEIFHAVHGMMDAIGDKFSIDSDEPYAYLCGWITDCTYRALQKYFKTKK